MTELKGSQTEKNLLTSFAGKEGKKCLYDFLKLGGGLSCFLSVCYVLKYGASSGFRTI